MIDGNFQDQLEFYRQQILDLRRDAYLQQVKIWSYYHDRQLSDYELARHLDNLITEILGKIPENG